MCSGAQSCEGASCKNACACTAECSGPMSCLNGLTCPQDDAGGAGPCSVNKGCSAAGSCDTCP
ncbi:MAG: hypothetical protein R3F14_23850 [Polyangiaceae bacterium]